MSHRLVPAVGALALLFVAGCSCQEDPRLGGATGNDPNRNFCADGRPDCAGTCCGDESVCASNAVCCERGELCGDTCCGDGQVCEGAACHTDCGSNARCRDEDGAEMCCGANQICISSQCFEPQIACVDFLDCPTDQYCEASLGYCLPQPTGEACEFVPTGGAVVPTSLWHWTGAGAEAADYNQVMMTPIVANLNDDNADGAVDERDIPDVIFSTFKGNNEACKSYECDGVLRAVSGKDGSKIFDVTHPWLRVMPGGQLAAGDLDGDGKVEIVACGSNASRFGPMLAFENDGTFKWVSSAPEVQCGQAAPSIADLDGDGKPEVFVRYTVLRGDTGALKWHRPCKNLGAFPAAGKDGGHVACDYTTAADLNGDGTLEVVGGNQAFTHSGAVVYDRSGDYREGYPAVADLDLDGKPEVVVVQSAWDAVHKGDHYIRAIRANGTNFWGPFDINRGAIPAGDKADGTLAGGGPPTVANFDDDEAPEIALAGAFGYVVFEADGKPKWNAVTRDDTSRKTGSSVFDFDGDGVAEAVYNDEHWLRVYNGPDGTVRYCQCNTSGTLWEYPVIADVNNDGSSEIIVAANDYASSGIGDCTMADALDECTRNLVKNGPIAKSHGVKVFASPTRDWVGTRRIWNQHTYHVTNVQENGAVPRNERPSWSSHHLNNFRQNLQPDATNLPDGTPVSLGVDLSQCPTEMGVNFEVLNKGWSALPKDTPVTVYVDVRGEWAKVATLKTPRAVLPGDSVIMSTPFPVTDERHLFRVVVNDTGEEDGQPVRECRDGNNAAEIEATCNLLF